MTAVNSSEAFTLPAAPRTLEDTGLPTDLVMQLVAKTLHMAGGLTGTELAKRLGVRFGVIEPALEHLKQQQQCQISGGAMLGGPSYKYSLTAAGGLCASMFLDQSGYVGPLPVTLDEYKGYMVQCARAPSAPVSRHAIREAYSHLVVPSRILDQIGPAVAARHSLFLYGAPGNGKTVIAEAIRNVLPAEIAIPRAILVEGHIVRVFDPVNHERVKAAEPDGGLERTEVDERWVRCRRPAVVTGGELTMESLELGSLGVGTYRAPLQLVANGGVLVIDDFGRQKTSPRELLNRWIVPLENRVDHLTLPTGQPFEVPFHVFVVFATNLSPSDLVDEAFLRRIQYKVLIPSPTEDEFIQIFENYCRDQEILFERSLALDLIEHELRPRQVQLRGVHPRDLIDHALALAAYLDQPRLLTLELLTAACDSYFVEDRSLATA